MTRRPRSTLPGAVASCPTTASPPSGNATATHEGALSRTGALRSRLHFPLSRRTHPAGARKVIDAIRAAIDDVAQNPLSGRRTSDPTVRVKVVSRYGYKIFYGVEADAIEILHVRHGARRRWSAEESR